MTLPEQSSSKKAINNVTSVFLVGNGPSLKGFDFKKLEGYDWVGMNAAYRYWEKTHIYPSYYACLDLIVGVSHIEAIIDMVRRAEALQIKSFLLRDDLIGRSKILKESSLVINFDQYFAYMPSRILDLVTTGSHCALWMAALGCEQIILLGIDANYVENVAGSRRVEGEPYKLEILDEDENENYFMSDYQRVGDVYTVPNPEPYIHRTAWRRVRAYLKRYKANVQLYNASERSQLDCINFISIEDFLSAGTSNIESPYMRISGHSSGLDNYALCSAPRHFMQDDMPIFLQALLPIHYGNILIQAGLGLTAFQGWASQPLTFESTMRWSGVYLRDRYYLDQAERFSGSGFVIIRISQHMSLKSLTDQLFMDFDAVYGIENRGNNAVLVELAPGKTCAPNYVIAFERQRFCPSVIENCFRSVMVPSFSKASWAIKRRSMKRCVRFYLKSLKRKFGD